MELKGKIFTILAAQTGEGKNGPWKKQNFVIEVVSNFPKKVCFSTWGDKIDLNAYKESDDVKVYFDAESREYNGNWYTELRCWKLEAADSSSYSPSDSSSGFQQKNVEQAPLDSITLEDEPGDDLPF